MINVTKVHNAQVSIESGNVSAIVFIEADKSVNNINEGRYEVDGVLKATFSAYAGSNLSVNFLDYEGMAETLEVIQTFLAEVRTGIKDIVISF